MTNLIARFSTLKARIQLHTPSCSVVAAFRDATSPVLSGRGFTMFAWNAAEEADAKEMGHKIAICKCAK